MKSAAADITKDETAMSNEAPASHPNLSGERPGFWPVAIAAALAEEGAELMHETSISSRKRSRFTTS